MKVLIVYGTTEGQTRKVANFLGDEAEKLGHTVVVSDATSHPPEPHQYDVVLVGASMHMHKYQSSVYHYIKKNAGALNKTKSAFFSVSLSALSEGHDKESWDELHQITNTLMTDTDWNPREIEYVAGALLYTKYDFFKRFIMRAIAKRGGGDVDTTHDHEYTHWKKVKAFLDNMLKP